MTRDFDDRAKTSEDPKILQKWIENITNLGLPKQLIDEACEHAQTNVIDFLMKVKESLADQSFNKSDEINDNSQAQAYDLPVHGWKDLIKSYYVVDADFDEAMNAATNKFPNNNFEQWRCIVLDFLTKKVTSLKKNETSSTTHQENTDYISGSMAEANNKSSPDPTRKKLREIKPKPIDFINTECIKRLCEEQDKYPVVQIHGGELRGKTYAVNGLAHSIADSELQVIYQLQFTESTSPASEVEDLIKSLLDKDLISEGSFKFLSTAENKLKALVEYLIQNQISSLFIFDNPSDENKEELREVANTLIAQDSPSKPTVQMFVVKNKPDYLFGEDEVDSNLNFFHYEITGFTEQESVDYLTSNRSSEVVFYHYIVDDRHLSSDDLHNVEDAEALSRFYGNNPGCLLLAKLYCLSRKLSYRHYLEAVKDEAAGKFVANKEKEIAEEKSRDLEKSLQASRLLLEANENDANEQFLKLKKILKILSLLSCKDIPVYLIGKLCQALRKNKLSLKETNEMNKVEASEMIYRMEDLHMLSPGSKIAYPNGLISLENNAFRGLVLSENDKMENLELALKSLLKLISKDNTEEVADIALSYVIPHIRSLTTHIEHYLSTHFNASDKNEKTFFFAMGVSRLYELLGHGMIQGRKNYSDQKVRLTDAARLIYNIVKAFRKNNWSWVSRCFSKQDDDDHDLLAYDEAKNADEIGEKIADECIAAGNRVDGAYIEKYLVFSLVLRKKNLEQFMAHTIQVQGISEKEATSKLKLIKDLVENNFDFDDSHMKVLRETGNFLTTEQLCKSFFADRLASIFHTLGRRVVYPQSKMPKATQDECEYYMKLSHNVAKAIREKTGVCLLFEYISMSNAYLHRLLQNTTDDIDEKLNRINEARDLCKVLLNTTRDHYENGCFQRVQGYPYAKLNVARNIVKANTKTLKYCGKDKLPSDALSRCEEILSLARENYKLDIAPHVFIQGAKFYAAIGRFEEAFHVFYGFVFKVDDENHGIMKLIERRPNTVAWAVDNFCRTVEAYSKEEKDEIKVQKKRKEALDRCQQVLNPCKIDDEEWQEKLDSWKKLFQLKLND